MTELYRSLALQSVIFSWFPMIRSSSSLQFFILVSSSRAIVEKSVRGKDKLFILLNHQNEYPCSDAYLASKVRVLPQFLHFRVTNALSPAKIFSINSKALLEWQMSQKMPVGEAFLHCITVNRKIRIPASTHLAKMTHHSKNLVYLKCFPDQSPLNIPVFMNLSSSP